MICAVRSAFPDAAALLAAAGPAEVALPEAAELPELPQRG